MSRRGWAAAYRLVRAVRRRVRVRIARMDAARARRPRARSGRSPAAYAGAGRVGRDTGGAPVAGHAPARGGQALAAPAYRPDPAAQPPRAGGLPAQKCQREEDEQLAVAGALHVEQLPYAVQAVAHGVGMLVEYLGRLGDVAAALREDAGGLHELG